MRKIAQIIPVVLGNRTAPWYLAGGIPAANCLAAFKPKGAASYAASKVNLVTPGVNDAADGTAFPTWAGATGWEFNGSTQYLAIAGAIVAAAPLSMVCRFNPDGVVANYYLMSIWDTALTQLFGLTAKGDTAGDPINVIAFQNAVGNSAAISTTGFTATNWFTAAGTFANGGAKRAYIDGGSVGEENTNTIPGGLDSTTIGVVYGGGYTAFFDGKMAACAFYNVVLTPDQVLALHTAMAAL